MTQAFHEYTLKRRFNNLNPGVGSDVIDWSVLGEQESYDENLEILKTEYPACRWEDKEDYDTYARDYLREEAAKAGLKYTNIRATPKQRDAGLNHMLNTICEDIQKTLILLVSERGWGKSTSLKTIIAHLKQQSPETIVKVIDISLSWYRCAPLKWRQYVTMDKIVNKEIANIEDCVYEVGDLPLEIRRQFLATLINQDTQRLRQAVLNGEPTRPIIYVLEEASTYVGSYALRKNDEASTILSDFVNVGRNLSTNGGGGLSAFMVCTAEVGELSPSLRRRARRIYGRVTASGDLAEAKRRDKHLAETIQNQKPYHFTYAGKSILTCKIPDTVRQVPTDYHLETQPTTQPTTQFNASWWFRFGLGAALTLLTISLTFAAIVLNT